jgi:hypothetical protein
VPRDSHPAEILAMIERVTVLTADEAESLGQFWKTEDGLTYFRAPGYREPFPRELPLVSHPELNAAWQRAEDEAAQAGRVDELDAAIDAEHAAEHRGAHLHLDGIAKSGALVAARSTVLAVGIRDLLAPADYDLLVSAWEHVLGPVRELPHLI